VNAAAAGLFDDVVAASGLNELIAPFTVSRLLVSADVDPRELSREGLARALPELERGLGLYLRGDALARAMRTIRALAHG
jgi:hypothetical protein